MGSAGRFESLTGPGAAALVLLACGPARGATLDVAYGLTLAGFPLGNATLHVESEPGKRYEARVEATLLGLAGVLVGGEGKATARGLIDGARLRPRYFGLDARYSGTPLTERMTLDDGTVARVDIVPAPQDRPDRVPPGPDDRKDVVDPLSGLLGARLAPTGPLSEAECARTVPVHDGTTRFDVPLSASKSPAIALPAVPGPLVACEVRYVPVSGHRPNGWAVMALGENKDMRVWLAPVGASGMLAPARILIGTAFGPAVAEAVSWTVTDAPRRRAPR